MVVRLLDKMRAIEHAPRCRERGDCRPHDMTVAADLASHMDSETNECIREVRTIANGCGLHLRL